MASHAGDVGLNSDPATSSGRSSNGRTPIAALSLGCSQSSRSSASAQLPCVRSQWCGEAAGAAAVPATALALSGAAETETGATDDRSAVAGAVADALASSLGGGSAAALSALLSSSDSDRPAGTTLSCVPRPPSAHQPMPMAAASATPSAAVVDAGGPASGHRGLLASPAARRGEVRLLVTQPGAGTGGRVDAIVRRSSCRSEQAPHRSAEPAGWRRLVPHRSSSPRGRRRSPCASRSRRTRAARPTRRARVPARGPRRLPARRPSHAPSDSAGPGSRCLQPFQDDSVQGLRHAGHVVARRIDVRLEQLGGDIGLGRAPEQTPPRQELPQDARRREQIVARVTSPPRSCSGDMYAALPFTSPPSRRRWRLAFATPKSSTRATPSVPTRTFCGRTSRWTMPSGSPSLVVASWAAWRPWTGRRSDRVAIGRRRHRCGRCSSARDRRARRALDDFHHQEHLALVGDDVERGRQRRVLTRAARRASSVSMVTKSGSAAAGAAA